MERLLKYGWPGNVRELEHVIEGAAILSQGPLLQIDESFLNTQTSVPTLAGTLRSNRAETMATKYRDLTCTDSVRRAQNEYYGPTIKIIGAPERDRLGQGEARSLPLVTASTWAR